MTVLFIIGSISAGLNMSMVKIIFLDNRNYPGGPAAFATQILSLPNLVCAACAVIGSWLADGLLVSCTTSLCGYPLLSVLTCLDSSLLHDYWSKTVDYVSTVWLIHYLDGYVICYSCISLALSY